MWKKLTYISLIISLSLLISFILTPYNQVSALTTTELAEDGQDVHIDEQFPTANRNGVSALQLESKVNENQRILLEFNMTAYTGVTITSANLSLLVYAANAAGRSYEVRAITSAWDEATVTWNTQPTVDEATVYGTATVPATNDWMNFSVTSLIQYWADGNTNYGLQIRDDNEDSGVGINHFRDETNSTHQPRLEFTYSSSDFFVTYLIEYDGVDTLYTNGTVTNNGSQVGYITNEVANITVTLETDFTFINYTYDSLSNISNPFFLTVDQNYTVSIFVDLDEHKMIKVINQSFLYWYNPNSTKRAVGSEMAPNTNGFASPFSVSPLIAPTFVYLGADGNNSYNVWSLDVDFGWCVIENAWNLWLNQTSVSCNVEWSKPPPDITGGENGGDDPIPVAIVGYCDNFLGVSCVNILALITMMSIGVVMGATRRSTTGIVLVELTLLVLFLIIQWLPSWVGILLMLGIAFMIANIMRGYMTSRGAEE